MEDGRESPHSLSSQESQLSHSMSSANQDVLNYLWPQLMQVCYVHDEVHEVHCQSFQLRTIPMFTG